MVEYIVNYNCKRVRTFDAILNEFREHDDFKGCGVKKICISKFFNGIKDTAKEMFIHGFPIEVDNRLRLGQFSIIMETFPKKETEQPQNNTDVVYIVKVKPEFQTNFKDTTINHKFAGKILAQIRDAYVFELNESSKAIVIIPSDWIECMAPSKVHFELMGKRSVKQCPWCNYRFSKDTVNSCPKCNYLLEVE